MQTGTNRPEAGASLDEADHSYVPYRDIPYRGHWLLVQRVLERTRPGDRILDGGVSSGYLARRFLAEGRTVDGVDIDPQAAAQAAAVCDHVWVGDLSDLDPTMLRGGYQLLLFGDTLEHLPDPVTVLRRLRPVLAADGHLVISIPNVANWTMRLALLFGRFNYKERGILDRTHLRFFTRKSAVAMLNEAGFIVERIEGAIPVPLVRGRRLGTIAHRIGNLWSSLFAYTFVICARPNQSDPSASGPRGR